MYSERLRALHQEGITSIRQTGRFLRRHAGDTAAAVGASLLAACASAPESRATSGPPAPPASAATQEATSTPEAQPTQPPATPTLEPAKPTSTPKPEPTPFTIKTPFLPYGVWGGYQYVEPGGGTRREPRGFVSLTTPLTPEVGGVLSYVRDTKCNDGSSLRTFGNILIRPADFINRGFAARGRFGQRAEGIMFEDDGKFVSGRITFPAHATRKECAEETVLYATSRKVDGPGAFLTEYIGLFKQAGLREGLTTEEALAEIEKDIGGVKLPQASK